MRGRFTQAYTWQEVYELYNLTGPAQNLKPNYNVAPTQTVNVIPLDGDGLGLQDMRWGLIPIWWKKPAMHMASSETSLPFDTRGHYTITFDLYEWASKEKARVDLRRAVKAVLDPEFTVSNPVVRAEAVYKMRDSGDPQAVLMANCDERLRQLESELSAMRSQSPYSEVLRARQARNKNAGVPDLASDAPLRSKAYQARSRRGGMHKAPRPRGRTVPVKAES